jgi:protein phosphatase
MKLATGAATDQGQVRDNNEDAYVVDPQRELFAVADGMGGHRGGEVASHTAIEALRAAIASGANVEIAITRANTAVIDRASGDVELSGMGTTLTALVVAGPSSLLVGHVGDSRAYLLHDGEMTRITDDHSLVEELVRDGRLTPEQAEAHPQRAIVTRALGVDPDVDVDLYPIDVTTGDRIILCSDGLTTMVRDRDVERIARNEPDPQRAAESLLSAANNAGGDDNITVVIVDVLESDGSSQPIAAAAPVAAEQHAEEPPSEPEPPPTPKVPKHRMRTVRGVILVAIPLLIILAIAVGAIGWYARDSYYVGHSGNEVVIYKGIPGGILGWNPTIDAHTGVHVDKLPALDRGRVLDNTTRGSLATAQEYVARLRDEITTTTTTTTTTTRPKARAKPRTTRTPSTVKGP